MVATSQELQFESDKRISSPLSMEIHDAITTWLEQGTNFLRVTTVSPLSSSTGRGRFNLARPESRALQELATFLNLSIPHTNWDAKDTRQMLKQYLIEYRSTVEAAVNPQLSLDEKDERRGIKTVQDKLVARCRHFQRLQQLHVRFAMEERQEEEKPPSSHAQNREQQTTDGQLQLNLTDAQGSPREKDGVAKEMMGTGRKKKKAKIRDTSGLTTAQEKKTKERSSRKERVTGATRPTKSVKKQKKNETNGKKNRRPRIKKQPLKEKDVVPLLIALTSDEDNEALPILRRSTRSTKRASRSLEKPTNRSDDPYLWIDKKKLRRLESASGTTSRAEMSDVTPSQAIPTSSPAVDGPQDSIQATPTNSAASDGPQDSTDVTATSSPAFNGPQGSALNDKNTPSSNPPSPASGNKPKSPTSNPARHASSSSASSRRKRQAKDAGPHPLAQGRNPASCSQKLTHKKATAVPNALRSAIAQAVSQRQQLLSRSQAERCQRSTSESDYGLSDIDLPTPSASSNGQRSSDGIQHEAGPSIGLLPPLIDRSFAADGRANLERKHVFLRAKKLAFDQLKWQRENEFQQQELELLRYETEAREALARQESRIKQMRIRAAVIQPMISAGASIADIVERLRLLL